MTVLTAGASAGSSTPAKLSIGAVRQQFQEQIDFFKGKLNLPSERWSDVWQAAHDRAFMVAGAQKADLLNDLRLAVDKSIQGGGIEAFRKDFWAAVDRSGWTGWTGQGTAAGEAWRTRVIYQTNMATSYAAGRWKQLNDPDLLKVRPYWKYIHSDSAKHPRLMHKAWGDSGLTLRHDHPFWATHFPPNGWLCLCRVEAVRAPGPGDATSPPDGWDAIDPKTGAPVGIDKGWAYAPGAKVDMSLRKMVQDKLVTYPAAVTRALTVDVNRYINAMDDAPDFVRGVLADRSRKDPLWLGFVEDAAAVSAVAGTDVTGYMVLLPADAPRHVDKNHGQDGGTQRPATPEDYSALADILNDPDMLRAGERVDGFDRIVVEKKVGNDTLHAVFEVRSGKKNRALALVTLIVKTPKVKL